MRLIDADALISDYEDDDSMKAEFLRMALTYAPTVEAVPKEDFDVLKKNYDMISSLLKEEHAKAVGTDTEPLVQVSEVTYSDRERGEWIYHVDDLFPCESTQECSVCHKHQPMDISDENFCPNCGADMRGDK